jgi:alpha-tubulin suppressor-like RCC1 family protein
VTAKALGVAIITATADGKSSSISVAGDQIVEGSVAAEDRHACAVTTTQAAICWGYNGVGQLGDNSRVDRSTPVTVSGGFKWKAVAVAPNLSCGLTTAGAAYCWGNNGSSGLGDGVADVLRLTPAAVSGGRAYQSIAAGTGRIVAVTDAGALYGWGSAMGDGTTSIRLVPTAVTVPAGVTFKSVSASDGHVIALSTTGAAYAWGVNDYGQIGDGSNTLQLKPVAVSGNLTFRQVTAGAQTSVGVTTEGKAYYWGLGSYISNLDNHNTPTALPGSLTFRSAHSGSSLFVGLSNTGSVYTWNGGAEAPVRAAFDQTFRTLSSASKLTVAAAFDGSVWSWGLNEFGQLGDGSALDISRTEPGLVGGTLPASRVTVTPSGVALLYQGGTSTMTVTLARTGFTGDVELIFDPLPGITGSFEPAKLTGSATTSTLTIKASATAPPGNQPAQIRIRPTGRIDQFTSTAVGISGSTIGKGMVSAGTNNCGLTVAGKAYCVDAATSVTEVPQHLFQAVPGGMTFTTISSGLLGVCGLAMDGAAYCWGGNGIYLGIGPVVPGEGIMTPTAVVGGLKFRTIDVDSRICGVTTSGDAYCWGDGTLAKPTEPQKVPGGIKFFAIDGNGVGLTSDGTPYRWDFVSPAPTKLSDALKFVALEGGGQALGGITGDGSLYTWGTGILGNDFPGTELTYQTIQAPTKVIGINPLRSLSMGSLSTAAVDQKGNLWWWGEFVLDGGSLDKCIGSGTNCPIYQRSKLPVNYGSGYVAASTPGQYGSALTTTGQLVTWGANGGSFGNGTTTYSRTPTALEPGFSMEPIGGPIWIEAGKTLTVPVKITRRGGFNIYGVGFPGEIALGITGTLPSGVTATVSPTTLGPDGTTATITITASSTATPGAFSIGVSATSAGMPDQAGSLSAIVPDPIPASGLNLVCPSTKNYPGYSCIENSGVQAPAKWAILPLDTPIGGSKWWVETGSEVCVQWDASNGNARVKFSGGSFGGKPTIVDGKWGILVRKDGTPEPQPGDTWLLFTSALDAQLRGLNYLGVKYGDKDRNAIPSGSSPVINYTFQKTTCPY